jgi:hypothetical protein
MTSVIDFVNPTISRAILPMRWDFGDFELKRRTIDIATRIERIRYSLRCPVI